MFFNSKPAKPPDTDHALPREQPVVLLLGSFFESFFRIACVWHCDPFPRRQTPLQLSIDVKESLRQECNVSWLLFGSHRMLHFPKDPSIITAHSIQSIFAKGKWWKRTKLTVFPPKWIESNLTVLPDQRGSSTIRTCICDANLPRERESIESIHRKKDPELLAFAFSLVPCAFMHAETQTGIGVVGVQLQKCGVSQAVSGAGGAVRATKERSCGRRRGESFLLFCRRCLLR